MLYRSFSAAVSVFGMVILTYPQPAAAQAARDLDAPRGETVAIPTIGFGLGRTAPRWYAGFEVEKSTARLLAVSVLADAWVFPQVCADSGNPAPDPARCDLSGWDVLAGATIRSAAGHSRSALFAGAAFGVAHVGSTHAAVTLRFGADYPLSSKVAPSTELRVARILGGAGSTTTAFHIGLRVKL